MAGVLVDIENNFNVDVAAQQPIEVEMKQSGINIDVNSDSALGMVLQAILTLKQLVANIDTTGAKESTLLQGIADLKDAFANIDLSSLETTLVSGLNEVKDAVNNIDFTDLETAIGEVKDAVANIDFSALAQETTLTQGIQDLKDVTAKETTLTSAKEEILTAVEKAKPEVDLSGVAKQGENPEATLTAIYKLLIGSNEPSPDIPEGVAERLALILEFFGMKPIEAYEFMTPEEVCSELEEIMTSMDLGLTQEMAATITNNTLNEQ